MLRHFLDARLPAPMVGDEGEGAPDDLVVIGRLGEADRGAVLFQLDDVEHGGLRG